MNTFTGSLVWQNLHSLFGAILLFGGIAAVLWLFRHTTKETLFKIMWISVLVGIVGLLLTAGSSLWARNSFGSRGVGRMMDNSSSIVPMPWAK